MNFPSRRPSRPTIVRGVNVLLIVALLVPSSISAISSLSHEIDPIQAGTIRNPANGTTIISTQGFRVGDHANPKKPARLIAVGPRGTVKWVRNGSAHGIVWFYDIDPLPNGNLLVTGTDRQGTVIYALDPDTQEWVWHERFPFTDTHDADLINGDQLLIANMKHYNETTNRNDERILIYDRSTDRIVWQWYFRKHYNRTVGAAYTGDWSHVNDVDKIGENQYLVSLRNFDQVILINRSTNAIEWRLGGDENHAILYEQHNPDYLTSANGTPTVLVADSENDRIVEYAKTANGWTRTWVAGSSDTLTWPRDADRLPNGNTLIVDTLNHRVIEVTPDGTIVWEFYVPWAPYDVERVRYDNEAGGPTMRDLHATGVVPISGSAIPTPYIGKGSTVADWFSDMFAGTPIASQMNWISDRWAHIIPWVRPIWMGSWAFVSAVVAILFLFGWLAAEVVAKGIAHMRAGSDR